MSSFAIGVHYPMPQRRRTHSNPLLRSRDKHNAVTLDIEALLHPKISLLKYHKNSPMSFQIAVSITGQSIQKRHAYLLDFKKNHLKPANSPLCNFARNIQLNTYTQIRWWFKKEATLKAKLRRFFYIWLLKKYKARMLNTEDPFTLSEPEDPVQIFDAKSHGTYIFDGQSIRKHIESCLGYNRWMIPEPRKPTNPLTNLVLTLGQIISIRKQLCRHGIGSWIIESFAKTKYNIANFGIEFALPLRLYALDDLYRNPICEDAIDEVREFISEQVKIQGATITQYELLALRWAVTNMSQDPYIIGWRNVWRDYFKKYLINSIFFQNNSVQKSIITNRIMSLFNSVNVERIHQAWLDSLPPAPTTQLQVQLLDPTNIDSLLSALYLTQYQDIEIHGNDEETTESSSSSSV